MTLSREPPADIAMIANASRDSLGFSLILSSEAGVRLSLPLRQERSAYF